MTEGENTVNLLDLSDDVLLYILRLCTPRDLKALGFSCARLGRLVRERSLWRRVDARSESCSVARLLWYVQRALHSDTRQLYVRGYAAESRGCLGLLNCSRKEAEEVQKSHQQQKNERENAQEPGAAARSPNLSRHHACLYINAHASSRLPRFRGSPLWEDENLCRPGHNPCAGPCFTVSEPLLRQLRERCVRLSRLALDHCNIDCSTTNLGHLPPTLTRLSLCGTKCFNLPIDKSFLFKIQDHLPLLESLDVSECAWLEPSSLLPLSKHNKLKELHMRDCHKLAEFVAYASLSSRYGFRKLQVLDLRGSPVGDSEVSPLAWLPELQQLKLSAATPQQPPRHAHYADDKVAPRQDLDDWELKEPDYFKNANGDDRVDPDPDVLRSDDSGGDDDDDDEDDDDGDDKDDNAGRAVRPEQNDTPNEGDSKTEQEPPRNKRKAENDSGDASVNGEQKKRRKSAKKRQKRDKSEDKDSEEERYEKRRCQTIVIVDRRTYADDESDDEDLRLNRLEAYRQGQMMARRAAQAPRYDDPGYSGENGRPENGGQNGDEQPRAERGQMGGEQLRAESQNGEGPKDDEKAGGDTENKAKEAAVKTDGEAKVEEVKDGETKPESQAEAGTSKSESDAKVNAETENFKHIDLSCNNDVNQGASTSKDGSNDNEVNTRTERYIRFRQGQQPVIVNVNRTLRPANPQPGPANPQPGPANPVPGPANPQPGPANPQPGPANAVAGPANGHGRPLYPPRRMRVNYDHETGQNVLDVEHRNVHYSIRHEQINNQRIYNVEVESRVYDRNQNAPSHEEQEDMHVRMFEQARNMERNNRNIMRLIRNAEPGNPYPEFPPVPAVPNQIFHQLHNYNPVRNPDNANVEDNREREPRHRVLYVNVGQPANSIGPLPNVLQGMERDSRILNLSRSHLEPSSLVTDSAVRRFGRAANNEIRFVLVGIPQPFLGPNDGSSRPERSSLRVLVMNGYRTITDRSLVHLATAAPYLQHLDVRETNVTPQGVENFRSLRPDCEVLFSPYVERKVEWSDEEE